ncbi:MAG: flagellar hook-length control protein FliK [Thiotrichales bacterium]|jgi:hypothetical protein|nr:flagellar hook-length control protein FliK [Thiotrichales bacterium]MBT3613915.1 flagellar hook-length control protein FliK [Thiotrichales bacterium]MBT3752221.1 flagellar hook-length control protein FliK [Thiotrichales bacterium]MBT3836854.1 flagellar hook-length control protein FliK [Thiotrichales bacterium]MBT4151791.1 flagellar hook-length control protein FliK [Thiotrichales bacterium]
MSTVQPSAPSQTITLPTGTGSTLPKLQVGQTISATVISVQSGLVKLQTSNILLTAKTTIPLQKGEQLQLTVTQLQPKVTLSLSNPNSLTTKPATISIEQIAQKIYPKQQPLQQILQSLGQISQLNSSNRSTILAIQQLFQNIPTLMQLFNPSTLKQRTIKSGSFMENNLLNSRTDKLSGDLKGQLLQLRAKLFSQQPQTNRQPSQIVRQIDAMLSRIDLAQLKTLQSSESESATKSAQREWVIEIPFMVDDKPHNIELYLQRQSIQDDAQEDSWHIKLTLSPPNMGEIHISAKMGSKELDINFLTEDRQSSATISNNLDKLEATLSSSGIETGTLFSRQLTPNDIVQTDILKPTGSGGISARA